MFYLGGLTLGYLSPHGPAAPVAAGAILARKPVSRQAPRIATGGDDGKEAETGDRPILWPWHLFC